MKLSELLEQLDAVASSRELNEEAAALVLYDVLCELSGRRPLYDADDLSRWDGEDRVRGNALYEGTAPDFSWIGLNKGRLGFQTSSWYLALGDGPCETGEIAGKLSEMTGLGVRRVRLILRRIAKGEYKNADGVLEALAALRPDFFFSCGAGENLPFLATCFLRCCENMEDYWGAGIWRCLTVRCGAADAWIRYLKDHEVSPRDRRVSGTIFSELCSERVSYSRNGMSVQSEARSDGGRAFTEGRRGEGGFLVGVMESLQCYEECDEGLFLFGIASFKFLLAMLKVRDFLVRAERKYRFLEKEARGEK